MRVLDIFRTAHPFRKDNLSKYLTNNFAESLLFFNTNNYFCISISKQTFV